MTERNWKALNRDWIGYKIFSVGIWSIPSFLLELIVFVHVYILAAFLAIREMVFDFSNLKSCKKIEQEIESSEFVRKSKSQKVALITGADGTIGKEIVRKLVNLGFLVLECRRQLNEEISENERVFWCDLEREKSVSHTVERILELYGSIDVAVFAAGVMLTPEKYYNGPIEAHNYINVVSQARLFEKLSKIIKRSVFLSSATARVACYSTDDDLLSAYAGSYQAYSTSKLNLAIYVNELTKKRKVSAISLHPGTVPGALYNHANFVVRFLNSTILPFIMRKPEDAALLVLHTVFRDDFQNGKYYEDTSVVNIERWLPETDRLKIYNVIRNHLDIKD